MTALLNLAASAKRIGLGPLVAKAASLAYRHSEFSVDRNGRWINRQPDATFVSPRIHTTSFANARAWVLDNWTWGYLPLPGDTVIDVGAGIGEEAVVFSKLVGPAGRVISIEAHPRTFSCLERTIELSELGNVTPVWCAASDRDGELFISDVQSDLSNTVVGQTTGTKVPARSLDSIAEEFGLDKVALVKMNIEGAEKLAVAGMTQIAARIAHAVISCHDFLAEHYGFGPDVRTRDDVRAQLEQQGFALSARPNSEDAWMRDYLYASRAGE